MGVIARYHTKSVLRVPQAQSGAIQESVDALKSKRLRLPPTFGALGSKGASTTPQTTEWSTNYGARETAEGFGDVPAR